MFQSGTRDDRETPFRGVTKEKGFVKTDFLQLENIGILKCTYHQNGFLQIRIEQKKVVL